MRLEDVPGVFWIPLSECRQIKKELSALGYRTCESSKRTRTCVIASRRLFPWLNIPVVHNKYGSR